MAAGCGVEQRWRPRGAEVINAWLTWCLCGTLREGFETAKSPVRKM